MLCVVCDNRSMKKVNYTKGGRLNPQQKRDALFWWHLYQGNASKVAKEINTTPKSIIALSQRENFAAKEYLVTERINAFLSGTNDPRFQRIFNTDLKILDISATILDSLHKQVVGTGKKKRKFEFRNVTEMLTALDKIESLYSRLVRNKEDKLEPKRDVATPNQFNAIFMNSTPEEQAKFFRAMSQRADFDPHRIIEGEKVDNSN